jgi:hypothetical protein
MPSRSRRRARRKSPAPALECAICLAVARRPTVGDGCAHAFCHACLERWAARSNSCPTCRRPLRRGPAPRRAIRRGPLRPAERARIEEQVNLLLGMIAVDGGWTLVL